MEDLAAITMLVLSLSKHEGSSACNPTPSWFDKPA